MVRPGGFISSPCFKFTIPDVEAYFLLIIVLGKYIEALLTPQKF